MADARHVRLPVIGVVRTKEPTVKLAALLDAGGARVLAATVSETAGRWFVSLRVEMASPAAKHRPGPRRVAGVDLGVKTLATVWCQLAGCTASQRRLIHSVAVAVRHSCVSCVISDGSAVPEIPEECDQLGQTDSTDSSAEDFGAREEFPLAATRIDPVVWYVIQTILVCAEHPYVCSACSGASPRALSQPTSTVSGGVPLHRYTLCPHAVAVLDTGVTPGSELDVLWPARAVDELSSQLVQRVDALWAAEADVSATMALADAGERLERLLGVCRTGGSTLRWPELRVDVPCRPTVVEFLSTRFLGGELINLV